MHIVITMAGHSRRFRSAGYLQDKFLINIEGRSMIEHVMDMFDPNDTFHFVINEQQSADNTGLVDWLGSLAKKCFVTVIPPHENGPVYSALQVKSVPLGGEVIVTYCDFKVAWDYRRFKREVEGYSAAIPAFRGFHPASFGSTYYAYMLVDENSHMLALQEKKSFTETRHEEYASTGIYYFKRWDIFTKYAKKLMSQGFQGLKEGYVSLLANLLVADDHLIKVTEVNKFICWGTPEDLEQYLFWSNYFLKDDESKGASSEFKRNKSINIIPMAGRGARFKDAGFRVSKPLIKVGESPMAITACSSFPGADTWVFLLRSDDVGSHPIGAALEKHFSGNVIIVPVIGTTSGQAATCLLAKQFMGKNDHLLIASCDYETLYDKELWSNLVSDETIDAAIWTCRLGANLTKNPNAFAYCLTANDGTTVTKIVEKATISESPGEDPLVVGTFWFRRAEDFIRIAEKAIDLNININGEHYVANSMNLMINEGRKIVIFDINKWISFGDPFELEVYYYWKEYFHSSSNFKH